MRMAIRRFTRLTNAFSKKIENHAHSVTIHFMHYNFVRIHQSLRVTPAMVAGMTDTLWSLTDMVRVIEDWETARSVEDQRQNDGRLTLPADHPQVPSQCVLEFDLAWPPVG
jgi:hypothetical protein